MSMRKVAYLQREPTMVPREEHNISLRHISDNALKVLHRLKNAGFASYLVGGSVRDLLLGREPKDFDVVTDARPEQIRELFRNSILIGRRFRLAHVHYGRGREKEIIEVSTFRAPHHHETDGEGRVIDGQIIRDNVYGNIDDDVWRRDFTINALFYNIKDQSVVDYVNGMRDIKAGHLRLIGDPRQRFTEDPVRLLRAVRFATKLGFRIHQNASQHIAELAHLLNGIAAARLFEECLKMFFSGCALQSFEQLRHYQLFSELFPQTEKALSQQQGGFPHTFLINALRNTDLRLAENKPVTPGFLLAALLWLPMEKRARKYVAQGQNEADAIMLAGDDVISRQTRITSMPRRHTGLARDIWQLQPRLERRSQRRPRQLLSHPRFRAAYDFLLLRAESGEAVATAADWWTEYQQAHPEEKSAPLERRERRGGRRRCGGRHSR